MTKNWTPLLFLVLFCLPQSAFAQSGTGSPPLERFATADSDKNKVECFFEDVDEGKRLVFRTREKPGTGLNLALHYDNDFGPGLILNYTRLNSLIEGSRLGVSGDISGNPQLRTYYDIHLGKKRNFITSLFFNGVRDKLPFFANDIEIGNYVRTSLSGGIGMKQHLGVNHYLGLDSYYRGVSAGISDNTKEVEPDLAYLDYFTFRGPELAFSYDLNTFDSYQYPTKGIRIHLRYRQAFATRYITQFLFPDSLGLKNRWTGIINPYGHLRGDYESYFRLGKTSLNLEFSMGITDNVKPFMDNFYVGGYRYNLRDNQVAFVGLHGHELLHGNYVKEKVALQFKPVSRLYLSVLFNFLFVGDDFKTFIDDFLSFSKEGRYMGAGAGFTYKSPVGPLSIYLGSRTDIWNPIWYINIGFAF